MAPQANLETPFAPCLASDYGLRVMAMDSPCTVLHLWAGSSAPTADTVLQF